MKRLLAAATAVITVIGIGLLTGCKGPAGPAGPAGTNGTNGTNGIDANKTCTECHASNQQIVAKQYEWEGTKHDTGTTWKNEGAQAACIACHNGSGFIFTLSSTDSANVLANPTNANCRTCHQIHTNYDSTDFALTGNGAPVHAKIDNSIVFDYGKGNLCTNCHQLRTAWMADVMAGTGTEAINPNTTITNTATMVGTDSIKFAATASRASNHYGAQAEILGGVGLWLPNGGAAISSSPHKTVVADGCVQCHLGPEKIHTYQAEAAACSDASCHGPAFAHGTAGPFDIDNVQTDVLALSKQLRDSLVIRGICKLDTTKVFPDPTSLVFNGKGKTYHKKVVGAFINLQTILWDGSKGAHNANFVKGLLNGSLTDLSN